MVEKEEKAKVHQDGNGPEVPRGGLVMDAMGLGKVCLRIEFREQLLTKTDHPVYCDHGGEPWPGFRSR